MGTRRILHWNVADHPTAEWTTQQFRMVVSGDEPHRFVVHDHDSICSEGVDRAIAAMGLTVVKTPVRTPQANAFCELLIGTIRRECLDFVIPLSERQVRSVLAEWVAHYNRGRPHTTKECPMRSTLCAWLALVSLATSSLADESSRKPTITGERIGSLDNAGNTVPQAIDNRGQVVGGARNAAGIPVAFLWTRRDGFQQLAENAGATDINERGDVTGGRTFCFPVGEDEEHCEVSGFVWTKRDGVRDLANFVPFAINDHGDMAGFCDISGNFCTCVIRDGGLSVGEGSQLYGINRRGDAVGQSFETGDAILWRSDGSVTTADGKNLHW